MKRLILFLVILIQTITVFSQNTEKYSKIQVFLKNKALKNLAALGLEVDHGLMIPDAYWIHEVSESEIEKIREAGFDFKILIPDMQAWYHEMRQKDASGEFRNALPCNITQNNIPVPEHYVAGSMGGYFTYEEMLSTLDEMHNLYPNIISAKQPVSDSLLTWEGRPIYYIKISDNVNIDDNEPELLYTALHHAREPNSLSQMIFYLWYLLENYDTNPEIKTLVDNLEMYFIPCINPDGYVYNQTTNPDGGGFWRKNRHIDDVVVDGVDINRNYGYQWGYDDIGASNDPLSATYRGTAPFSEYENQMVRDFCRAHEFKIALNYHTYGNLLLYPWAFTSTEVCPDDALFANVAAWMTKENKFTFGTSPTVLYAVNGGSDDWMYGDDSKPQILSLTPEVGSPFDGFWPMPSLIDNYNKSTLWQNLAAARLLLNYGEATETTDAYLETLSGELKIRVKNYSINDNASFTVTVTPLSENILSVGSPFVYNLTPFQQINHDFSYDLSPLTDGGEKLDFIITIDNGIYTHNDTITKIYGQKILLFEDAAADVNLWQTSANFEEWGLTTEKYHTPPTSITDSPFSDYSATNYSTITMKNPVLLDSTDHAIMRFWATWNIEQDIDYVQVLGSKDNINFTPLCGKYTKLGKENQDFEQPLYDGIKGNWVQEEMDLSDYLGDSLWVQFRLVSSPDFQFEGFYFDDVEIIKVKNQVVSSTNIADEDWMINQNFPNPTNANTVIEINPNIINDNNYSIRFINTLGMTLEERKLNTSKLNINTSNWQSGVYYYQLLKNNKTVSTKRLVVVH